MRILSAAEMREVDRRTIAAGHATNPELMEAAGRAVAEAVRELAAGAERITVVCGKGNNGGDGLVAARYLAADYNVTVVLCAHWSDLSPEVAALYTRLEETTDVNLHMLSGPSDLEQGEMHAALRDCDVVVDALLGTGFKPPIIGIYADVIAAVNKLNKFVVAVDLPSGADADAHADGPTVRADAVVTFTAPKRWHVWSADSDVPTYVAPIGTPDSIVEDVAVTGPALFTPADLVRGFFDRKADSNKGSYGHVLVIGGSLGKAGAPAMSALAALRAGAGLATAAVPGSALATVAGFAPEVMTEPLDGRDAECLTPRALDAVRKLVANKSVIAIGPGLGGAPETIEFVHALIGEATLPVVLDADGLNAFAKEGQLLSEHRSSHLIITPHPGEMGRLIGSTVQEVQSDRVGIAIRFARERRCTVVLKGWRTVVAFPSGEAWINPTGNPGMSTGGTGDALTGMVAGLLAQKPQEAQRAVLAAVFLHGLAGDIAASNIGRTGMIATDLIHAVPHAFTAMRELQRGPGTWLHHLPIA